MMKATKAATSVLMNRFGTFVAIVSVCAVITFFVSTKVSLRRDGNADTGEVIVEIVNDTTTKLPLAGQMTTTKIPLSGGAMNLTKVDNISDVLQDTTKMTPGGDGEINATTIPLNASTIPALNATKTPLKPSQIPMDFMKMPLMSFPPIVPPLVLSPAELIEQEHILFTAENVSEVHSEWFWSHSGLDDIYVVMMAMGSSQSLDLASTAIKSILHSFDFKSSITFIIMTNDVSGPFPLNVTAQCVKIMLYRMDTTRYDAFVKVTGFRTRHYSETASMSKLFVTKIIPGIQRFFTMDSDIIVMRNIRELWDAALGLGKPMASVCMRDSARIANYCGKPGEAKFCHPTHYCNGGIMFYRFDLSSDAGTVEWWVKTAKRLVSDAQVTKRIFSVAEQDLINYVAATNIDVIGFLPCEWNCDTHSHSFKQLNQERCPGKTCALLHYVNNHWKTNKNELAFYRYFWDAYRALPSSVLVNDCAAFGLV